MKRLTLSVLAVFVAVAGFAAAACADVTAIAIVLPGPSYQASLVCRTAKPGETANAKTTNNTALACKSIDMKALMEAKSVAEASDVDPTWEKLMKYMSIEYGR